MRAITTLIATVLVLGMTGCAKETDEASSTKPAAEAAAKTQMQKPTQTGAPAATKPMANPQISGTDKERLRQTVASSFGKGTVKDTAGNSYTFQIEGSKLKDDSSYGKFRFYSFQGSGKLDVTGTMTCVHINSPDRQIWMAGEITKNSSTDEQFKSGNYAIGGFVQFRARPNMMKEQKMVPGAIEIPAFVDASTAAAFCKEQSWANSGLIELGENDLIAAIP